VGRPIDSGNEKAAEETLVPTGKNDPAARFEAPPEDVVVFHSQPQGFGVQVQKPESGTNGFLQQGVFRFFVHAGNISRIVFILADLRLSLPTQALHQKRIDG
jgi:hypothetical protein